MSTLSHWCSARHLSHHVSTVSPPRTQLVLWHVLLTTSTIGKVLERLIANRLSWWIEEQSALCPWQAGFRTGRSTTEQCLRLSPLISDGFQWIQRRRTIVTLINFSRAYDRVWRIRLLMKMLKMDIPRPFTEWLSSWFIDLTARVWVSGSIGPSMAIKEGLPHGPVFLPILFTIYVSDHLSKFKKDTFVSVCIDDLLIARSSRDPGVLTTGSR